VDTFEEFVAARGTPLLRLAVMLTGNVHDAEDLLQTTFVKLLRGWDRVAAADLPAAYARRMLVNEHLSWRRRPSRREHSWADDALASAASAASTGLLHEPPVDEGWALLATLPRQQRTVLALRYYEDLSDAQIAGVLDCSESTVRSNASRALATLRSTLPALDEEASR
jgi:RNA polymerase sigma-70 factor (sigma-E family)